jgi:glycosyltransferase involved in cell wall biosynthesis
VNLRILHFVNSFAPIWGGKTTRLLELLRHDGNMHSLVVPRDPSPHVPEQERGLSGEEQIDNFTITRIPQPQNPPISMPMLDYIVHSRRLVTEAIRLARSAPPGPYDLISGHTSLEFGLASLFYAATNSVPLIYEAHGLLEDSLWQPKDPVRRAYHRLMQGTMLRAEARVLKAAHGIIVQTESMKDRIARTYRISPERICVIPNGVNVNRFDPARWVDSAMALRASRAWGDRTVVLYAGFLDRTNGVHLLLDLAQQMPDELREHMVLAVAGRGELERQVERSAALPWFDYLGVVAHDKMPALYGAADLVVIPRPRNAASETLTPVKLLEAMAMAKPVLVSDVPAMTELIQDGVTGFTFSADHMEEFGSSLISLCRDNRSLSHIGHEARTRVVEGYQWSASRARLDTFYHTFCYAGVEASVRIHSGHRRE